MRTNLQRQITSNRTSGNRWRNRYDEPMQNPDLWREFLAAFDKVGMTVHIGWTHGEKSTVLKEVDKAAKSAAKRGGPDVDRGYARGAISRSMLKGTAATRFVANGQTAVIRPYRKDMMSRAGGENKVRFNVFSEATESFVESSYAYATPEMAAELHRQNGYRVRFNDNPQYPQILEIVEQLKSGRHCVPSENKVWPTSSIVAVNTLQHSLRLFVPEGVRFLTTWY